MSLQFLNEGGVTRIDRGDRGEIEVGLTVQGGPARLLLEGTTPDYVPIGHPRTPLELVAALQGPARVVACPLGERFLDGTTVQVTVRTKTGDRNCQVVGPRLDVGALPRVALAEITPQDEQFTRVQALRFGFGGPSEGLTDLGRATHSVARGLAWSALVERAPAGLAVAVDASASMLGPCRSGLLQVLMEVILGIDRGLGDGDSVPVVAVGATVSELAPIAEGTVGDYAATHLEQALSATGFRPELLAGRVVGSQPPSLVLVVTDWVTADVARSLHRWSAADTGTRWRLVVLAPPDRPFEVDPWAEVVGHVDPDAWTSVSAADRGQLQELILALVGRAGSHHQEV
jgi:hypothetical protein